MTDAGESLLSPNARRVDSRPLLSSWKRPTFSGGRDGNAPQSNSQCKHESWEFESSRGSGAGKSGRGRPRSASSVCCDRGALHRRRRATSFRAGACTSNCRSPGARRRSISLGGRHRRPQFEHALRDLHNLRNAKCRKTLTCGIHISDTRHFRSCSKNLHIRDTYEFFLNTLLPSYATLNAIHIVIFQSARLNLAYGMPSQRKRCSFVLYVWKSPDQKIHGDSCLLICHPDSYRYKKH